MAAPRKRSAPRTRRPLPADPPMDDPEVMSALGNAGDPPENAEPVPGEGPVDPASSDPRLAEPEPAPPPVHLPAPEAVHTASAEQILRRCATCLSRRPLADLGESADTLRCRDTEACAQRAARTGIYAQDVELALAARGI